MRWDTHGQKDLNRRNFLKSCHPHSQNSGGFHSKLDRWRKRIYLRAVLKPFREKVVYVAKCLVPSAFGKDGCSKERLFIAFYSGGFTLPDFDPGKMYSGMKLGNKYTLKELGITYKEGENEWK
jgi:hypothetical protein